MTVETMFPKLFCSCSPVNLKKSQKLQN